MFAAISIPPRNSLQVVAANAASINLATAFGASWGQARSKLFTVPAGVVLGPVTIPTGMLGELRIINDGEIQGLGGAANSGDGGHAITAYASFELINNGAIRGGGGGGGRGGKGGKGGNGQYTTTVYSGSFGYSGSFFWFDYVTGGTNRTRIVWSGTEIYDGARRSSPYDAGTYTYYRGTQQTVQDGDPMYSIRRSYEDTTNTTGGNGGNGGNGGVGQGYGQSATSGSAGANGANGGTNAGDGGKGGTGAAGAPWGTAAGTGATGSKGQNGNTSNGANGSVGIAGGDPGYAVRMIAGTLDLQNNGTIDGLAA